MTGEDTRAPVRGLELPPRERQALAEAGVTAIGRPTAVATVAVFLAIVLSVAVARLVGPEEGRRPFRALAREVSAAVGSVDRVGALAANRRVLRVLAEFEDALDETSPWRALLLDSFQGALTRWGGVGNEQALLGFDSWLFYRPDVETVTGPPFLDSGRLEARGRGGESWEPRPRPDSRPALLAMAEDLRGRGADLVLLPVPAKVSIEGHHLSWRVAAGAAPLHNASWEAWLGGLRNAGVEVVDPTAALRAEPRAGAAFLARDTHWRPEAMERVAAELAQRLEGRLPPVGDDFYLSRREAVVDGTGDLTKMLGVAAGSPFAAPERVTVRPVLDESGRLWQPTAGAPVLVLGDSYTNVFSDESLGWGSGAGLAEQLAYHLQRPVDRVARNAGGAWESRAALAQDLAAGRDRLDGVRIVVYEFAARELAFGDWREVELPES